MMSKTYIIYCTNCGESGHSTKQCLQPITSFGTIIFRVRNGYKQTDALLESDTNLNGLEGPNAANIEYLLIQRRDSLGFIDIMRGKYRLGDIDYIKQQIRITTHDEQRRLLTDSFDTLWEGIWGPPVEGSHSYRHEKEQSRAKLETLRNGSPNLEELIKSVGSGWDTPEWGFPKGRRDLHETEYACALREMWEETGITERDLVPIRNLEPVREVFFGSNHIQYCHKYFIFFMPVSRDIAIDPTNEIMRREVGDLRWCSLEPALRLIRPENVEKREVLLSVSRLLRNYCPFLTFELNCSANASN
jgi:8-oxo-dGTP pyrophosphatase MutT (NUDIX family)